MKKQTATIPAASLNQNNEVSQKIADTQQLINKIKHDYKIAAMLASSALSTIEKMSGEIDFVTKQLTILVACREGTPLKVLSFGKEQQQ